MPYPMNDALRQAATLMAERRYLEAIEAYRRIGQTQPEHGAIAASQVGAAYFFLRQYPHAIQWYRYAGQLGFDAQMTADNVAEAETALAGYRPELGDVALMDDGQVLEYHGEGGWRPRGW
jgi:tetratricopeptide (TPR) repeat protein